MTATRPMLTAIVAGAVGPGSSIAVRVGDDDRCDREHREQRDQRPVAPVARCPTSERRVRTEQRSGHRRGDRQRQVGRRPERSGVVVQHVRSDESVHERHHRGRHQRRPEQADLGQLTLVGEGDHDRRSQHTRHGRHDDEAEQHLRVVEPDVAERTEHGRDRDPGDECHGSEPEATAGGHGRALHARSIGVADARLETSVRDVFHTILRFPQGGPVERSRRARRAADRAWGTPDPERGDACAADVHDAVLLSCCCSTTGAQAMPSRLASEL